MIRTGECELDPMRYLPRYRADVRSFEAGQLPFGPRGNLANPSESLLTARNKAKMSVGGLRVDSGDEVYGVRRGSDGLSVVPGVDMKVARHWTGMGRHAEDRYLHSEDTAEAKHVQCSALYVRRQRIRRLLLISLVEQKQQEGRLARTGFT